MNNISSNKRRKRRRKKEVSIRESLKASVGLFEPKGASENERREVTKRTACVLVSRASEATSGADGLEGPLDALDCNADATNYFNVRENILRYKAENT